MTMTELVAALRVNAATYRDMVAKEPGRSDADKLLAIADHYENEAYALDPSNLRDT